MTERELNEHARYVADGSKMRAYREAIRHALADGASTVLDLGSGSGILGLIAAQEGATRVYAVDSGPIIGPATDVAAASGFGSTVIAVNSSSTGVDLPERVDVAVCDQIGGFVHDAGVLRFFADARRRHLKPDGRLIPSHFQLFMAPATCSRVRDQIDLWNSHPEGLDFSAIGELAVNTEHRIDADECTLLSPGVPVADIDADHDRPITASGSTTIDRGGSCDGLVGWFEADLGGGTTLTNHPARTSRMQRWCNFYPLTNPVPLEPGDQLDVDVDVRPLLNTVTWKVTPRGSTGAPSRSERHSTLLGQFIAPGDLGDPTGSVQASPVGQAVARAIALADGTRSAGDIISIVREEFDPTTITDTQEDTIRTIIRRFTASG